MKDRIDRPATPLHRSWVRLLPYTTLGAFLISVKAAANFNSLITIYLTLMAVQLGAIAIYFLINKSKKQKK